MEPETGPERAGKEGGIRCLILGAALALAAPTQPNPKPKYLPDILRVRQHSEFSDLPFALMLACWKAEQGVPGYEWGQRRISWEIPLMFPEDVQMAQAARTLRNAKRQFVKLHPDWYASFKGSDAEFLETYITRFVEFLRDEGWGPEADAETWGKNVLRIYRAVKARDKFTRPPSKVVR
jgi:hypothetical protein